MTFITQRQVKLANAAIEDGYRIISQDSFSIVLVKGQTTLKIKAKN